jgi:hypothetical protein
LPRKNVAYRVYLPIFDADGDLVSGATGLDSEISKDGAAFADCTNEATEIGASGVYYLDLTSTEMNADAVCVIVKTSTSGAKTTPIILYPEEQGDIRIDPAPVADQVWDELRADHVTAGSFGQYAPANVTHISGDSGAADNAESFFDGTGYAGTNNVIPVVTTVNGLGAGVITAASIAADAITAAKIAADAIGASELATDAITEIVTALLTTAMTESYSTDGGTRTLAQALYEICQLLQESSVSGTTVTVKKVDGTTTAYTLTTNSATTPTSVTRST